MKGNFEFLTQVIEAGLDLSHTGLFCLDNNNSGAGELVPTDYNKKNIRLSMKHWKHRDTTPFRHMFIINLSSSMPL